MSRDASAVPSRPAADTLAAFQRHGRLIARLHDRAGADRWNLSIERFTAALVRSCERRFRPTPLPAVGARDLAAYLESLHVADLALACACADGSDAAWDEFMQRVRPDLYVAARAMAGGESGRELADSLYADLYGVSDRNGHRRPLFEYFHGRSKLSTWLRSVLAQRHVDRVRAARRTRSLDEGNGEAAGANARQPVAPDQPPEPDRPRLTRLFQEAVSQAVAALPAADRLRLSYYYLHSLTLAEIGRLMGEHESSASRKLERSRRALRADIERRLARQGLDRGDVRQCYEWEREEGRLDTSAILGAKTMLQEPPGQTFQD